MMPAEGRVLEVVDRDMVEIRVERPGHQARRARRLEGVAAATKEAAPVEAAHELEAVHVAVRQKVAQRELCPVCAGARLWQDARWHGQDWNFGAVRLLWEAVVDTINQYGTGWSAWRPVFKAEVQRSLPPKLQMENIPLDQVEELPEGVFKWGRYRTDPGTESLEVAWACLNQWWQEDRAHPSSNDSNN